MGDPGIKLQLVGNKAKNLAEVYQKFEFVMLQEVE
jgi:hypothetical protein